MVSDAVELHRLLATRGSVLEAIDDGNRRRDEIMESIGIAKSTAYKALKELRENELVRENGKVYELTPYGECALERYRRTECLAKHGDIINLLGEEIDTEPLLDAEVVRPEPGAPMKPVRSMEEVAGGAEGIRGLVPVVMERYVKFTNELLRDGINAEFVVERAAFDELSERYEESFEENLRLGTDVYVTDASIPCGLLLTESAACFVAYQDGSIEGCIVADDADNHAEDLYADYRNRAHEVLPD